MITLTPEQKKISRKNRDEARKYFIEQGIIPKDAPKWSYALHHKDESLRHNNIERYILWLIEDLEVEVFSEHSRHHNTGRVLSDESRQKSAESHKGQVPWNKGLTDIYSEETKASMGRPMLGEKNPMWGKHHTDETKKRIGLANSHPNPKQSEWAKEHAAQLHTPEARQKLSISMSKLKWWNNGEISVRKEVCPEGFIAGRLKRSA